jgi:hypothetical protein
VFPLDTRRRRYALCTYAAVTGAGALAITLAQPVDAGGATMDLFWWTALGSIAAVGSLVALHGLWTATGAYAVVFWCFHLGLVAVLGHGLVAPGEISTWDQEWVLGPFAADAALLALTATLALASGASLVRVRWPETHHLASSRPDEGAHPHGLAGSVLVCAAIATWCGIVVFTGGARGFLASYAEYLQMTSGFEDVMAVIWLAVGCGIVMSVTGRPGWARANAIALFGCLTLVALPLGLRGEILFPAVAALVAAGRCGRVLSPRAVCSLGLALLVVIPVGREIRTAGVRNVSQVALGIRPLDAFAEMGASLHPVEKVVRWRAEGEPLEKGASYWAPIERAARRILPGLASVPAADDPRIMNILVLERVGAIGFSPVAEAYRNFGAHGVLLVFAVLGAILAALDSMADRRLAVLAIATVYLPLLINVRNSFISVPAQCAAGVLLVLGLAAVQHIVGTVLCRPYESAAYLRSSI